jgi:hypothetical protein
MIVFDLVCQDGRETFEAWFRSTEDFENQQTAGLIECPMCQSSNVAKAPMAPRVPRKGRDGPIARLAAMQAELLKESTWVGDSFADTARAMHNGEVERAQVHGKATLEQTRSLIEDGVPVAPLPLPVTPPNQVN